MACETSGITICSYRCSLNVLQTTDRIEQEIRHELEPATIATGLPAADVTTLSSASAQEATPYWNQFRGPQGDGISVAQELPVELDEATNAR